MGLDFILQCVLIVNPGFTNPAIPKRKYFSPLLSSVKKAQFLFILKLKKPQQSQTQTNEIKPLHPEF